VVRVDAIIPLENGDEVARTDLEPRPCIPDGIPLLTCDLNRRPTWISERWYETGPSILSVELLDPPRGDVLDRRCDVLAADSIIPGFDDPSNLGVRKLP
jgi:hypothetical protein